MEHNKGRYILNFSEYEIKSKNAGIDKFLVQTGKSSAYGSTLPTSSFILASATKHAALSLSSPSAQFLA